MTDKQIIIDGIDVSGCKYWKGYCRIASLCDYPGHLCEVNPNCYYKQLKRKEQECEELNEELYYWINGEYCDNKCNVVKELDQLKVENEHLSEKEEEARHYLKEAKKFKNCINEIKEIAENREIFCENCGGGVESFTCDDCGYVKILQKISECEGTNDN